MPLTSPSVFHPSLDDINLLVHAAHWDPFSLLGQHAVSTGDSQAWVVRAFLPEARDAWVVDLSRGEPGIRVPMDRIHPDGLFECAFTDATGPFRYRLALENYEGHGWEFVDPYQFGSVLSDFDLHLLGEGTHYRNFERLGAHVRDHEGYRGVHFAVWAPNSMRVSVVGDFNHWDGRRHPDAQLRDDRDLGTVHPRPARRGSLQVRDQEPVPELSRAEVRPLRVRRGDEAQDRLGRLGRQQVRLE